MISCDAANRSPDVGNCSLAHKNKKKLKLSLSKPKKTATGKENFARFDFVDEAKAETLSKRLVPKNTATSTKWCVSTFESW